MIVALVRDDQRVLHPLMHAEPDHAGILPGTQDHAGALHREVRLQHPAAALVRAVLAPHGVEDRGLDTRGIPPQELEHAPRFTGREPQPLPLEQLRQGLLVLTGEWKNVRVIELLQRALPEHARRFGSRAV